MSTDPRELAVEIVDDIHGYTYEYAPDPGGHKQMYDEVEEKLRALRASGRAESLKHFANTLFRLSGEAQSVPLAGKRVKLLREMAELANERATEWGIP